MGCLGIWHRYVVRAQFLGGARTGLGLNLEGAMLGKLWIFIVLFSLSTSSAVWAAGPYGVDYGTTKPDPQTVRVVSDSILWDMVSPFEKKQNVDCKIVVSDQVNVENPHWICLGNQSCDYSVVVKCYDKTPPNKQRLRIEISGFDDTKEAKVESFTVYYLH